MDCQQNGLPTQVLLVSGKKTNQAVRDALRWQAQIQFEEAILSQKRRNDAQAHPQRQQPEEAEHHDAVREH